MMMMMMIVIIIIIIKLFRLSSVPQKDKCYCTVFCSTHIIYITLL